MPGAGAGWAAAAGGWEAEKLRGPRRPWTWLAEGGGGSEGEYPRWRCPPSLPVGAKSAGGEREREAMPLCRAGVGGGGREGFADVPSLQAERSLDSWPSSSAL